MKKKRRYIKRYFLKHADPNTARLERLRKKLGLSMQRFSALLGITLRTYQRYVTTKNPSSPPSVVMLLAYYVQRFPRQHEKLVAQLRDTR